MKSTAFDMAMVAYRQNDMEGAFRQFLSLAEAQDADAMNMAANMFERGQGTYRAPGRAVFWWKKAVELGNVDALADYGHYLVTTFFDGKEPITATGLLTLRQIHIFAHSMCRKGVCLNISSDSTDLETIMYIWQRYFRR